MKTPKHPIQCDSCKFWRRGDLSAHDIGNQGVCVWTLDRTSGFYDRGTHVPDWARKVVHMTLSFEGKDCPVHSFATSAAIKANKSWGCVTNSKA